MLALLMRRSGWSAQHLSDLTHGTVSASSIRAYARSEYVPKLAHARSVAACFTTDGPALLREWGHADTADGLESELAHQVATGQPLTASTLPHAHSIDYPGDPLSDQGAALALAYITWLQSIEARLP